MILSTLIALAAFILPGTKCQDNSSQCSNDCSFCEPDEVGDGLAYVWQEASYSSTTTVTAGTVISIINSVDGTTRTSTILNELPSGLTPALTNAGGTHVETVSYTIAGVVSTTVLAFPTSVMQWPSDYLWAGTLLTTDSGGVASCVTVPGDVLLNGTTGSFTEFPPQPPATITPHLSDGMLDPQGLLFTVTTTPILAQQLTSYFDDPVIQTCEPCFVTITVAPVPALTVQFVTQTSTSYEGTSTNPMGNSSPLAATPGQSTPESPPSTSTSLTASPSPGTTASSGIGSSTTTTSTSSLSIPQSSMPASAIGSSETASSVPTTGSTTTFTESVSPSENTPGISTSTVVVSGGGSETTSHASAVTTGGRGSSGAEQVLPSSFFMVLLCLWAL